MQASPATRKCLLLELLLLALCSRYQCFHLRTIPSYGSSYITSNGYSTACRSCETYCPDPSLPRADSLTEASSSLTVYPPLIHHLKSEKSWSSLSQFIKFETKLPIEYILELINFGAVYLSVPNDKKIKNGSSSKSNDLRDGNLMTRVSRISDDGAVLQGSYCRVHVNPRRYVCIYIHTNVCIYVCMYVCIYMYTY
jgi:hypothetical protein